MSTVAAASLGARGFEGAARALADVVAGSAASALVDLFVNDIQPSGAEVLGDFTLATYVGYTQGTVAGYGTVHHDGNDAVADSTNVISFTGPVGGLGPVVYGFVLHKVVTAVDHLIAAFRFDTPQSLTDDSYVISVVPSLKIKAGDA
jgi:hypothetical protein